MPPATFDECSTPYVAVGDLESNDNNQQQTNKSSLKKNLMLGSVCLLGVALIVGLSVGLPDKNHHGASNSNPGPSSANTASIASIHVICGGGVQGSSAAQKVVCYPTTNTTYGITFNTESGNLQNASSFCKQQLASELGVSDTAIELTERIIVPASMANQCSQYTTLGSSIPAQSRAAILNISSIAFSSTVSAAFGILLTKDTSLNTLDTLSSMLLSWFKSSPTISSRTSPTLTANLTASILNSMAAVDKEMLSETNDLMTPNLCNGTFGFTGDSLAFCTAAMGKTSFTKYLIGLEASNCKSCTAMLYSSTLCGTVLQKTNFTISTSGLYSDTQLYAQCKTFMQDIVSSVRHNGAAHRSLRRKLLSYDAADDGGAAPASDDGGAAPASDDVGSTAASDDVGSTAASDDVGSTAASDDVGSTAASDDVGSTAASDDVGSTAASDDATDGSTTSGDSLYGDGSTSSSDYYDSSASTSGDGSSSSSSDYGDGSTSSSSGDGDGSTSSSSGDGDGESSFGSNTGFGESPSSSSSSSGDGGGEQWSSNPVENSVLHGVGDVVGDAMDDYANKVGGVAGEALKFGAGLAKGQSVYSDLGNLAVAGATAAVGAACPECVGAYNIANDIDPQIGKDVHSFATSAAKDVCTGVEDAWDDATDSGDGSA